MSSYGQLGTIALVGSGEYLPVMNKTDSFLLETLKNHPNPPRVVIIPTASGQEANGPQYWTELGLNHFRGLGVAVEPAMIVEREDAFKPEILAILEQANFYYFSGGNPTYLISTLADSPALPIIQRNHAQGAVLAGCSAGAMAMSAYTISIRAAMSGQTDWVKGWGIAPNLITFPHFDRMANFAGSDFMSRILQNVPSGCRVIGIDEDTALVRINTSNSIQWQVMGSQTVSVFGADSKNGKPKIYRSGEIVALEA